MELSNFLSALLVSYRYWLLKYCVYIQNNPSQWTRSEAVVTIAVSRKGVFNKSINFKVPMQNPKKQQAKTKDICGIKNVIMAKKCIKLGLLTTEVWLIRPWLQLHRHWLNKYSSHQHLNNSPDLLADQDKDLNKYHCCFSSDPEKDDKRKKKQIFI